MCAKLHAYISVTDRSTDTSILQMAVDARRAAEATAKHLLLRADDCSSGHNVPSTAGSPWEDLSSSRTARLIFYAALYFLTLCCAVVIVVIDDVINIVAVRVVLS